MKRVAIICILFYAVSSSATKADSTFQRHKFSISLTNAMSQTFFDRPGHKPTANVNYFQGSYYNGISIHDSYLPLYAANLQLHYGFGITPIVRIETGIGYLFSSSLQRSNYNIYGDWNYETGSSTLYTFTGSISLPLYVTFTKQMKHGAFTCTLGPDFNLPVHYYIHETERIVNGQREKNIDQHGKFQTSTTAHISTMGMYLKVAYEKKLPKNLPLLCLHPNRRWWPWSGCPSHSGSWLHPPLRRLNL